MFNVDDEAVSRVIKETGEAFLDYMDRNFRDLHDEIESLLIGTERRHINEQYRAGILTDVSRRRIERELDLREAELLNQRADD